MSKPSCPSDPAFRSGISRTFFVTSRTAGGRRLFQTDRMATRFVDVLRGYTKDGKFTARDFVVMPDHVHVLLTIPGDLALETAVQLIKGSFSFRAGKELGFRGEIWQRGYSDVRITDQLSFYRHRDYIYNNPVRAGLADAPDAYRWGSAYLKKLKRAGERHSQEPGTRGKQDTENGAPGG
jgi:REP-associated tyrosine transposase